MRTGSFLVVAAALFTPPTPAAAPPARAPVRPSAAGVQFFESKIRPVLVKHCYKCHSAQAKKLKGKLHLDTRAGLLKGGATGPAIVPGQPIKSLLIKALRHDGLEMPKEKLPAAVI